MRIHKPYTGSPVISVVVPSLDRPKSLDRVLHSLKEQWEKQYEVIVLTQKGPLAHLRNLGWQKATAPLVVFVDDDVWCEPQWLKEILQSFSKPGVRGVSGPAIMDREGQQNRDIFKYRGLKKLYDWAFLEGKAHLPGHLTRSGTWTTGAHRLDCTYEGRVDYLEACNMAYRVSTLKQVGGFDEAYAGIGDWSEPDLACRVRHRFGDDCLVFNPRARLHHEPSQTGPYLLRYQAKQRIDNYILFADRHIKPCWSNQLYRLFIRSYYTWKESQCPDPSLNP